MKATLTIMVLAAITARISKEISDDSPYSRCGAISAAICAVAKIVLSLAIVVVLLMIVWRLDI